MPHIPVIRQLKTIVLVLVVSATVTGCSKKEEKPVAAAPAADSETNVQVAATAPATPAANIPALTDIPVSTDVNQSIDAVDAALKANAYEKAAQTLLAVQKQNQLTAQQAQKAHSQMVGLQRNLATAMANGDPNAKAAAELLRKAALK